MIEHHREQATHDEAHHAAHPEHTEHQEEHQRPMATPMTLMAMKRSTASWELLPDAWRRERTFSVAVGGEPPADLHQPVRPA
jgi:hypothetical protein